jgi:hypothetical protein
MMLKNRTAGVALAVLALGASAGSAQSILADLLQRHGVQVKGGGLETAFDAHAAPAVPVAPGAFATPLAILSMSGGRESDRADAAYAFAILAGRSGRAASPQELAAAGQALVGMIASGDRRARITGARVSGRLFAAPYDKSGVRPVVPVGTIEGLYALLNRDSQPEQLAAMDALGLLREASAVSSLGERYQFYKQGGQRALAGGALEALARIGDQSSVDIVRQLTGDKWAEGRDATALAVAFARERLLRDGSIATIQQALEDGSRRNQARGYLAELGAPVP